LWCRQAAGGAGRNKDTRSKDIQKDSGRLGFPPIGCWFVGLLLRRRRKKERGIKKEGWREEAQQGRSFFGLEL
jgi:hypothetical protein